MLFLLLFIVCYPRAPATWNYQTLVDLDILPLYLSKDFYVKFDKVCDT